LWGVHMNSDLPFVVTIKKIERESETVSTLFFNKKFQFSPGQFVMVWVPGVDEVPMALSSDDSITVQNVGIATKALTSLNEGSKIGIRGPYGNGFSKIHNSLGIAGGVGIAPILPLLAGGYVKTFLYGARTSEEILFYNQITSMAELQVATDDGTMGHKGLVLELMNAVKLDEYDLIVVCGPERMVAAVFSLLESNQLLEKSEFSLHRYMKCGLGICGSCCIDPSGVRICKEGPVFRGDFLTGSEIGHHYRDASGRSILL